jgi:predicted ATPase
LYEARPGLVADESQHAALRQLDQLHSSMRAYGESLDAYSHRLSAWRSEAARAARVAAEAEAARRRHPRVVVAEIAARLTRWLVPLERAPDGGERAAKPTDLQSELSEAERAHPFWRSGLGRMALDETAPAASPAPQVAAAALTPPPPRPPTPPRGLFLYGEVGVGKTLAMDLFFQAVSEAGDVPCLRRVHYNAFMLEVHSRLQKHSMVGGGAETTAAADAPAPEAPAAGAASAASAARWHVLSELVEQLLREAPRPAVDPTSQLIADLARDIRTGELAAPAGGRVAHAREVLGSSLSPGLLCFDELQMMDVADATIVTGVLRRLAEAGWVVVATCNRSLPELLQSAQHVRHPHAAFARVLDEICTPLRMTSALGDYREQLAAGARASDCARTYLHPITPATQAELTQTFAALAGGAGSACVVPVVFGRELRCARQGGGVAWFSFDELCCQPLGAADYVALADVFHTVVVCGVPVLSAERRDLSRRFITLVDCLYNRNGRLVCLADAPLRELFDEAVGDARVDLESLEFEAEAGKADELGTLIGNTNAPINSKPAAARVSADNRKALQDDERYSGADERFAFRRALSRMLEMQSEEYRARRARQTRL